MKIHDCIIIGGGQAGLSVAYFLRRHALEYLILDNRENAGGAWQDTWDSLKLFSPATYSSLSGWMMPKGKEEYPSKEEFIEYLVRYEAKYNFPIQRQTEVQRVHKEDTLFVIETNRGLYYTKTLVSATGTAQNPYIPNFPNQALFNGQQLHSQQYKNSKGLEGKKVMVVGGGNSGAQILAEVSKVASCKWVTTEAPYFLPEEIDGRYLFEEATRKFHAQSSKQPVSKQDNKISLNNIVQVEVVKEALKRNVFESFRPFHSFYKDGVVWANGNKETVDTVLWCTGFKANLEHLSGLNIITNNRINTVGCRSILEPHLWLVGYGNWTGFASATIYGVGKTARQAVQEIISSIDGAG